MSYGNYPDLSSVKRILVIKMRHHGDVLLTSPVFSALRKALPEAQIDAFIYEDTLPMLEGHPAISQFILYSRAWKKLSFFGKLAKEFSLLWQIRKNKYDLVINLTEGDRGAIAAFVSGSRYKAGFDPGSNGFKGKKKIYTHLVKNCPTPRHTVERQLDLLRRLGIFPAPEERDLTLFVPEEAKRRMLHLLAEEGLSAGNFVVIHPVSRWRFKCLPTASIAELIKDLHRRGEKIMLTAGPDAQEKAMVEEIMRQAPDVPVCNFAGKMHLKELCALIQMSRALICVDSVPLHIASALKTPLVVLFGPTSELNWGPWMHAHSRVLAEKMPCRPCFLDGCGGSKKSDCLAAIKVSEILKAFEEVSESERFAEIR